MDAQSSVAHFLVQRIAQSQLTQAQIAKAAGFDSPNIITMLKQGKTKLPLDRVGPLARALDACPVHLLKMCLQEYMPQTWESIAEHLETTLTDDELHLVRGLRDHVGLPYLAALRPEQLSHLQRFLQSLQQTPSSVH